MVLDIANSANSLVYTKSVSFLPSHGWVIELRTVACQSEDVIGQSSSNLDGSTEDFILVKPVVVTLPVETLTGFDIV